VKGVVVARIAFHAREVESKVVCGYGIYSSLPSSAVVVGRTRWMRISFIRSDPRRPSCVMQKRRLSRSSVLSILASRQPGSQAFSASPSPSSSPPLPLSLPPPSLSLSLSIRVTDTVAFHQRFRETYLSGEKRGSASSSSSIMKQDAATAKFAFFIVRPIKASLYVRLHFASPR